MINEITMFMTEAVNAYDIENRKIQAVSDANFREYNLNKAKIELKIMQESGTVEDYMYLMTEAEETFGTKVMAVLHKIKETFIKFIETIKEKIKGVLDKITGNKVMSEVSDKLKTVPAAGKKKILVPNVDAQNKVYNETMSKLEVAASKAAAGQKVSKEDIDKIMQDHRKKRATVAGIAAAVAVTATAAVALAKSTQDKAYSDLNTVQKKFVDIHDTIKKFVEKLKLKVQGIDAVAVPIEPTDPSRTLGDVAATAEVAQVIEAAASEVNQWQASSILNNIKSFATAIKSFFTNLKNSGKDLSVDIKTNYDESVCESDPYFDPECFPKEEEIRIDDSDDPADDGDDGFDDVVSIDDEEDEACGSEGGEGCKEERRTGKSRCPQYPPGRERFL